MRKIGFGIMTAVLILLCGTQLFSDIQDIYCHFSLVEGEIYIFRFNQDEAIQAVVNYPLVPGDVIYTNSSGKGELQFNNGTIMRMDKHTELQISTILSPSLTSKKKITTLHLKKGQLYSMNQVYQGEIFQVITPTASIKMLSRSTNTIAVNPEGETHVFVKRGQVDILFNGKHQTVRQKKVGAGNGYWIGNDHQPKVQNKNTDIEFALWNQKINRNFKDLHYGKSKIPPVIYRRSPGIVHFAERFSTRFGSWEYTELFGYVWKPGDFVFHGKRPFFDANYVKINQELVLVPNQAWGWAPAHLGTWFWSKTNGWIWIPGDAFSRGICSTGLVNYPWDLLWATMSPYFSDSLFPGLILQDLYWNWHYLTPNYWINKVYGNPELYSIYRKGGAKAWRSGYLQAFKQKPPNRKPDLKNLSKNIQAIISQMNRVPVSRVETYLAHNRIDSRIRANISPIKIMDNRIQKKKLSVPVQLKMDHYRIRSRTQPEGVLISRIDWNPDARWSKKMNLRVYYSNRKNEVRCPKLKLTSATMNQVSRSQLKRSVISSGNRVMGGISCTSQCTTFNNSSNNNSTTGSHNSSSSGQNSNSSGSKK